MHWNLLAPVPVAVVVAAQLRKSAAQKTKLYCANSNHLQPHVTAMFLDLFVVNSA